MATALTGKRPKRLYTINVSSEESTFVPKDGKNFEEISRMVHFGRRTVTSTPSETIPPAVTLEESTCDCELEVCVSKNGEHKNLGFHEGWFIWGQEWAVWIDGRRGVQLMCCGKAMCWDSFDAFMQTAERKGWPLQCKCGKLLERTWAET